MAIDAKCIQITSVSRVKIEERGRSAIFKNEARAEYAVIRVDGCVISGEIAADWVVERVSVGSLVVELKGCDVGRALEQLDATLSHWKRNGYSKDRLGALVVCSQYPAISTKVQRAIGRFLKQYGARLCIASRNREYAFEDFF